MGLAVSWLPAASPAAAQTLFSLTMARESKPVPATFVETVVTGLDRDTVSCTDEPIGPADTVLRVGGLPAGAGPASAGIVPRKRVRYRAPVYPRGELDARRQGLVIAESIVAPSGCVVSARIVRCVSPSLDAAALLAISGWRDTPTLVEGKPAPLAMTVPVNFSLQP